MTSQDISDQILNDIEKDKIKSFTEDKIMFEAVKKYVLAVAYQHGTFKKGEPFNGIVNYALQFAGQAINADSVPRSDEELGQNIRALTQATSLVESGFKELKEMVEVEKPLPKTNVNEAE